MERRTLLGALATAAVVVGAATYGFLTGVDPVPVVLSAGAVGGLLAGALSASAGHVGAGARAGGYGAAAGFAAFVVVGGLQAVLGGDLSVLVIGVETLLIALLVLPLEAFFGAVAAALGVRLRRAGGLETAL